MNLLYVVVAGAHHACAGILPPVVVVVSDGDSDFYGDGTATHVASLEVGQQVIGGLRIVCMGKEEPLRIAGVFTGSEQ